jgi:hypothetical protein
MSGRPGAGGARLWRIAAPFALAAPVQRDTSRDLPSSFVNLTPAPEPPALTQINPTGIRQRQHGLAPAGIQLRVKPCHPGGERAGSPAEAVRASTQNYRTRQPLIEEEKTS